MQTFAETVTPRRGTPASIDIDTDSRLAEAAMPAGVIVTQGTAVDQVKVPASAADVVAAVGAVIYNPLQPAPSDSDATNDFAAGNSVLVAQEGDIWVICEDAITAGNAVYCRHTANGAGKLQLGAVRSDNDGGGATVAKLPGCRARSTTTGAGVVKLRINLPFAPSV